MIAYRDYRPTEYDHSGAFLPERRDWLVLDVMRTRDSDALEESNFESALGLLRDARARAYEQHSFNHWGCGWFEVILVKPGTVGERVGRDIERRLENYPVLDEEDFSEREWEQRCQSWDDWGRCDFQQALEQAYPWLEGYDLEPDLLDEIWRRLGTVATIEHMCSDGPSFDIEAALEIQAEQDEARFRAWMERGGKDDCTSD